MDREQEQIRDFMDKAGQPYPTTPTIPDEKTIKLRLDLITEEVKELAAACGYDLTFKLQVAETDELQQVDLVEVADALTDINYVTKGAGIAFGIDLEPIFTLVQNTNMAKFGPGGYRAENGKWMKPPDWMKPNIAEEINRQMKPPDVVKAIDEMIAQVEQQTQKPTLGRLTGSVEDFAQRLNDHNARVYSFTPSPKIKEANEFLDSVGEQMKVMRGEEY